jgi:protease-4
VHRTREAGKPILISVSNAAASGGYLIACPADTIVANPSAIVGSIGVFAGKLSIAGLYEKLGIRTEVVQRGESAGLFSTAEGFNPRQRELIRRSVHQIYRDFVSKVADARDMSYVIVDSLGEGRIYTATQGAENGLVDEIGDLHRTIHIAKAMTGIRGDAQRIFLPRRRSLWWPSRSDLVPYALQNLISERMWMMMDPWIE